MNPVFLQKQLKDNANDLQDFYKDLKNWGEEMKHKEDSLKVEDSKKKKKNSNTIPKKLLAQKQKKIGTIDYSKWDKYDADLECERLEDDFLDDSDLTDEIEDGLMEEAITHKEKKNEIAHAQLKIYFRIDLHSEKPLVVQNSGGSQVLIPQCRLFPCTCPVFAVKVNSNNSKPTPRGNSFVKLKEWDKAIDCYSKAINCYAYDPIYYANRALCHLKKNSFISAEEDCTLSLKLDSTYVKALQRRAAARESLGKLDLALADLELVLSHEPHNKESKSSLDRIRKKLNSIGKGVGVSSRSVSQFATSRSKTQPTTSMVTNTSKTESSHSSIWPDVGCEIVNVKSIVKPPHLRSSKPLIRINIEEINSLSQQSIVTSTEPEAVKKHVIEHVKEVCFDDLIAGGEPAKKLSTFKKNRDKAKIELKDETFSTNTAWPYPQRSSDIIKRDDLLVVETKEVLKSKPKETKNSENMLITHMNQKSQPDGQEVSPDLSVPKTSVQFYSTWKTLKTVTNKYKYLKLLKPREIPNIFKESLDSTVFSSILEILSSKFISNNDEIYEFLSYLTKVSRFSALIMFMDPPDKEHLWKIITYLREKGHKSEEVQYIIDKYEL